jgi:hypothetical protein
MMRARLSVVLIATSLAVMLAERHARAESSPVFGIHFWDWGANLDVMSWQPGWVVEANASNGGPNIGGRYDPALAEGFTIIQRLDWSFDCNLGTIPKSASQYPTFAQQCAVNWARPLKNYCRHFLIGNEMEICGPIGATEYAACFSQVRDAIKAENPEAIVIIGHFTNENNLRTVMQILGPNGYDGISDHTGSSVSYGKLQMLDDEGALPGVGMYISEWGWVAGTNPNASTVMLGFYNDIADWNATHDRQIYAACWYLYPSWLGSTFSLESSPTDNQAFEACTTLGTALNRYADDPIVLSNLRMEVSTSGKALIARWDTDDPSTTQLWYYRTGLNNGEFRPLIPFKVTQHQITMDDAIHVSPQTQYTMVVRSTAWEKADGHLGPLSITTGPWTVTATNVAENSATINWTTMFAGTSRVEYGPTTAYGQETTVAGDTTNHSVPLTGLASGTVYHYRVWTEATGYAPHHSQDLTFETSIPPGPWLEVTPGTINITGQTAAAIPDSGFNVRNAGGLGTVNYSISPGCSWVQVDPVTGSSTGESDPVTLSFDTTGLPAGEYTCPITVTSPDAPNSPVVAPVITLTLTTVDPDFDGDGDVDMGDFGHLQECYSGGGVTQSLPQCQDARLDEDDDVDGNDYSILQGCMSGAGQAADPACVD